MKVMKVHGYEVPQSVEDACLAAMVGEFTARDIEGAAIRAGAPQFSCPGYVPIAHWVAQRLMQRERKAGRIKPADYRNIWVAIPKEGE